MPRSEPGQRQERERCEEEHPATCLVTAALALAAIELIIYLCPSRARSNSTISGESGLKSL